MSNEASRRFTDREVALVLKRATEIEGDEGLGEGGGLTRAELEEIANEVGISREAIGRAVDSLARRRPIGPGWAGAPLVRRAVHAVPGELEQDAIARLVQLVDDETHSAGTISEALGSVRWTSSDRLKSQLISFTPEGGETRIRVVEKALPRLRRVFHLLPAAWAVMIGAPVVGALGLGAVGSAAAIGLTIAGGLGIGRGAWNVMSGLSGRRVERLAATISEAARAASAESLPHKASGEE